MISTVPSSFKPSFDFSTRRIAAYHFPFLCRNCSILFFYIFKNFFPFQIFHSPMTLFYQSHDCTFRIYHQAGRAPCLLPYYSIVPLLLQCNLFFDFFSFFSKQPVHIPKWTENSPYSCSALLHLRCFPQSYVP